MKTKTLLVILAILSIPLLADKFKFDGMRYRGETVKEYDISEKGSLVMDNIRGDIEIVGEARSSVLITEKFSINAYSESDAEKIYQDYKSKYILKGNTLIVEGEDHSRRYQCDFKIQIPADFNLDIRTSGGDILTETVNGVVELHTSGGDIDILKVSGSLNLHTSGGDIGIRDTEADVEAVTSGGDIHLKRITGPLLSKTSGGDITLEYYRGYGNIRTSGGDIYVAHIKGDQLVGETSGGDIGADDIDAKLELATSGGDISVSKVSANTRLHTSVGDIDIDEVNGDLEASTSGGDIDVGKVDGSCVLNTSGGDIDVKLAGDNLRATTSGGDIYLASVFGAVYAHTSGGDIEMQKYLTDRIKDNSIELQSSGGNIYLALPDKMKADVFAQITVYNKWDKSEIRSDFPLDITKENRGSRLIITGRGRINGGGNDVTLKTSGGDIKLDRKVQ